MAFVEAQTCRDRRKQIKTLAFWKWMLQLAWREFWYGPEPRRFGQWVYHPHRRTWEWRESTTTWVPENDHP